MLICHSAYSTTIDFKQGKSAKIGESIEIYKFLAKTLDKCYISWYNNDILNNKEDERYDKKRFSKRNIWF